MKHVDKPWGYEIWFAEEEKYVGKLLFVKRGERLSLQYHEVKDETLYILSGLAEFYINDELNVMVTGDSIHLPPLTKHRIKAIHDTFIIEVSTPEVDDVVRLEDDYGRAK